MKKILFTIKTKTSCGNLIDYNMLLNLIDYHMFFVDVNRKNN